LIEDTHCSDKPTGCVTLDRFLIRVANCFCENDSKRLERGSFTGQRFCYRLTAELTGTSLEHDVFRFEFLQKKVSNFYFSERNSRRFSGRRRRRIFIFRSEEAIDYLFFGEKKPSTIFRTEEPIGSLFFDFFSDRKSRRLSIFRLFFSGRRSHRLFIFLTKEAVHFLFSCRFSLFNDFSVPVENCNFDVFYLFPYLHQAAYN